MNGRVELTWILLIRVDERSIWICLVLDQLSSKLVENYPLCSMPVTYHLGDLIVTSSWGTEVESTTGTGNTLSAGGAGGDETTLELDVKNWNHKECQSL